MPERPNRGSRAGRRRQALGGKCGRHRSGFVCRTWKFLLKCGPVATEQRAATQTDDLARWGAVFSAHAVLRTRFFDDYLLAAADAGIRQVVLVAAGLDTRAFRLPWPEQARVYELDLPEVLAFKDAVLSSAGAQPRCRRSSVAVDLRHGLASTPRLAHALAQPRPRRRRIRTPLPRRGSSRRLRNRHL